MDSSSGPAAASSDQSGSVSSRCPDVRVFHPASWSGEHIDGAFLVDSFYYMKERRSGGKTRKVEYMPEMLQSLWESTGLVFMAVCSGGAALVHPHGSGAVFEELLARVPSGLGITVAVICGNDFLRSFCGVRAYESAWEGAV